MSADLLALASRFNEPVSSDTAARIEQYLDLLLVWNRAINLTGAATRMDLVEEHLPDAFALCGLVGGARRMVDVGSGGGLPGIPFALLRPGLRVTLSEPRSKRRAFLAQAVHQLGLSCAVTNARSDALPAEAFDVAVARAVFAPGEWVREGGRLVGPEGRVIVLLPADSPWQPPQGCRVLDEVRYSAGPRPRLAVALSVPRGT